MQTSFSSAQLKDPQLAEADEILRRCTQCGICNAACPTYLLKRDEREGPRGRIYLMNALLEPGSTRNKADLRPLDNCLTCLSCVSACPDEVDYGHLLNLTRVHLNATTTRPLRQRLVSWVITSVLPDQTKLRTFMRVARLLKPLEASFHRIGFCDIAGFLAITPAWLLPSPTREKAARATTARRREKRVILHSGCTQQVLRPEINDATIRLLTRRGVDIEQVANTPCCGAYANSLGQNEQAIELAKLNVDAWTNLIAKSSIDTILINGSSCGTMIKDYPHLLAHLPDYAQKAKDVAAIARDVTQFLDGFDLGPPKRWSSLRIAYHAACSMLHGQQLDKGPGALLVKAGFAAVEVGEANICCGASNGYFLSQPDMADQLRQRKIEHIERAKPDLVASSDIGCISHLAASMETPIVHTIELLDWAYGGPVPRGLERLAKQVSDVPQSKAEPFVPPTTPPKTTKLVRPIVQLPKPNNKPMVAHPKPPALPSSKTKKPSAKTPVGDLIKSLAKLAGKADSNTHGNKANKETKAKTSNQKRNKKKTPEQV